MASRNISESYEQRPTLYNNSTIVEGAYQSAVEITTQLTTTTQLLVQRHSSNFGRRLKRPVERRAQIPGLTGKLRAN